MRKILTALVVAAVAFAAQSMGAKDEVTQSKYEALFDALWAKVDQNFYDPHFHGVDWRAAGTRYREKLPRVHSDAEFERLATAMLDGLHASHTYIRPPSESPASSAGIGVRVHTIEGRDVVTQVAPLSDAWRAGLRPGDVLLSSQSSLRGEVGSPAQVDVARCDGTRRAALEAFARQALHDADATGFIHVRDVSSGRVLAHVTSAESNQGNGPGIDSPVLPLSVIKVYLAAVWLEHGFGSTKVDCAPSANKLVRHMLIDDVLISGCDSAAGEMAVMLRKKFGASKVLRDLYRYGIENLTLKPDASDSEWRRVLSLGEDQVKTTPRQLSAFMLAIGQGGGKLLSAATAERLTAALEAVVQDGTATSIKSALNNTGWHIGGKTGTGPGECGERCDGWFASLLRDPHHTRYVILVLIQGRGLGGGLAARTAASTAQFLAAQEQSSARKSPH